MSTGNDHEDDDIFGDSDIEEIARDDFPTYFLQIDNRLYTSSTTAPYPLPVDTPEMTRVDVQHSILEVLIGANYLGPVRDVLAPEEGRRKVVIDIGTGRGKWLIEMAREFPHVHFIGLDIAPISPQYDLPDNVVFEIHDINEQTRFQAGSVDLVHARSVSLGVRDFRVIINEAARLLRPGGLFFSGEWARRPVFHPQMNLTPSVDAVHLSHFFQALTNALEQCRGIYHVSDRIPDMILQTGLFRDITRQLFRMPIGDEGPWQGDQQWMWLGRIYRACIRRYVESCKRILLEVGLSETQYNALYRNVLMEIKEVPGLIGEYNTVYASRL
ncbi:sam domain [Moniliophthora roreri MCA 2997]|uniref:Sam domain n=2 Tax=Moniliophthora roreri TaxID=221103 RepID=V2XGH2_MONRO|nr:sam domain [Moniliophthora roreri MCA 2997]KAI3607006.1 sam domain [Moniliophthora roreri]